MKQNVTAIFDIGKTNKKFFLFDEDHNVVHSEQAILPETTDDDGFPCEDIAALTKWVKETLAKAHARSNTQVTNLNSSAYGASFVHVDAEGNPVAPLYNYLKPFPAQLKEKFFEKYGDRGSFCTLTASPDLGMLNSGLQLYWLKHTKAETFKKIKWSLHLPQYLSFLFTGKVMSDYTSIGCHTALWDFQEGKYHRWVTEEKIDTILPPVIKQAASSRQMAVGQKIRVGLGIHDSSAALVPYLLGSKERFILLSTGTWNIALNPFADKKLTSPELNRDCLNYMRPDGKPVKASRLFFGNEFSLQVKKLSEYFHKDERFYETVKRNISLIKKHTPNPSQEGRDVSFHFETMQYPDGSILSPDRTELKAFKTFEEAYHQLLAEMMAWQVHSLQLISGGAPEKIFVDGGFANNEVFLQLLGAYFPKSRIIPSDQPNGSALGAAMLMRSGGKLPEQE